MDSRQKTIKRLESFLEDYNADGICGFLVDAESTDELSGDTQISVIIILDIDWVQKIMTKPEFVAKRFRSGIKSEIQRWLGLDVYVGSTARKCDESVNESHKKDYIITESQLKSLLEVNHTSSRSVS